MTDSFSDDLADETADHPQPADLQQAREPETEPAIVPVPQYPAVLPPLPVPRARRHIKKEIDAVSVDFRREVTLAFH